MCVRESEPEALPATREPPASVSVLLYQQVPEHVDTYIVVCGGTTYVILLHTYIRMYVTTTYVHTYVVVPEVLIATR